MTRAEIAIDGGYVAAGTANLRNRAQENFAARAIDDFLRSVTPVTPRSDVFA